MILSFSVAVAWPKPSIDSLGDDISMLVTFWNTINADKKHLKSFVVSSSLDSVLETPERRTAFTGSSADKSYGDTQQVRGNCFSDS